MKVCSISTDSSGERAGPSWKVLSGSRVSGGFDKLCQAAFIVIMVVATENQTAPNEESTKGKRSLGSICRLMVFVNSKTLNALVARDLLRSDHPGQLCA